MFPIFLDHNPKTLETHFNFFRYDVPNKMLHIEQTLDIRKIIIPNDIPKHFIGLFYRSYNCIQRLYSVCREFFIPNEQNLKIEIVDDKLYFKKQEKTIGYMQYWFDNYQTYTYSEAIPCSGVATYFNLDYIKDLRKQGQISLIINKKNYKSVNMKPFEVTENQYKLLKMDQIV